MTFSSHRSLTNALKRSEEAAVWVVKASFFVLIALIIATLPSAVIRWSAQELPRWLHGIVLAVAAGLLFWGIFLISTEDLRERSLPWLLRWFGELAGPVIFIGVLLLTTAEVFASFTFMLFDTNLVELTANIEGRPVDEGTLIDFYMWHFLNVIPVLSIPELLNLRQPISYSGTWIGVLVLSFDAMIVLILIPTFRFWLRYRREKKPERDAEWERAISSAAQHMMRDNDPAEVVIRWSDDLPEEIRRHAQDSPEAVVVLTYGLTEALVRSALEAAGHPHGEGSFTIVAREARNHGVIGAEPLEAIDEMSHLLELTTRLPSGSLSAKQALQFTSLAQAVAETLGVEREEFLSMVEEVMP